MPGKPKFKSQPRASDSPPASKTGEATSASKGESRSGASKSTGKDAGKNTSKDQNQGGSKGQGPVVLYWFRTDLRLTDSPALAHALSLQPAAFYPVWCWDPQYIYGHRVGLNRWSFLLESMQALSSELTRLNPNQRLHVVRGGPTDVLPMMVKQWGVTHVVFEKDSNAYAKVRDKAVREVLEGLGVGVEVVEVHGRHLYDPQEVGRENGGKATMTLHQWQSVTAKMGEVEAVVDAPEGLPDPGEGEVKLEGGAEWKVRWEGVDMNEEIRTGEDTCFDHLTGPDADFAVPTMSSMGFGEPTTTIRGGTLEAHASLDRFLSQPLAVATFSKPHTAPTSLEPATTLLSPHLKFGTIGVREVWWGCKKVIDDWRAQGGKGGKETKEPENMFGQLQFRDMYAVAECWVEDFQRIRGNKVCRFIDWKLQNQYDDKGNEILPRPRGGEADEERFLAWKAGRTGFPWIDACMRQLKVEGWIHHLARHSTACFLTRGQCYISWERGMEVYDEYLIDWDPASNPGNWMWLSCSAFFSQYYRVYGLESWPMKTDKSGALVRKYCPELKDFPDKYIYCPHKAPPDVQQKAHCIIGQDYPFPMLDEHIEKDRCIARLKAAYALGLHGDAPEVLDGSAKRKLREQHKEAGVSAEDEDTAKPEVMDADKVRDREKEKERDKGEKKRKREGNASLDGVFKVQPKPESKGKSASGEKEKKGKPASKKAKKEPTSDEEGAETDADEQQGAHGNWQHGKEVSDEEKDDQVKETVQADSEHGAAHQKAEQGDAGKKARNLRSRAT